jgi:intracellular multiplication protein IcmD
VQNYKKQTLAKKWFHIFVPIVALCAFLFAGEVFGDSGFTAAGGLGTVAATVTQSFSNLARLITGAAYIAGLGFALSALLKFKQHKDNPQQIPIGTPIALLFIGAALVFLPTILGVANQTLFSGQGTIGGPSGVST